MVDNMENKMETKPERADSMGPIAAPAIFEAFLEKLIGITDRYINQDASFLREEEIVFHRGQNKAFKRALELYRRYHRDPSLY